MPQLNQPLNNLKIKQIFLIATIAVLLGLIVFNLALFLPALLGALTLYIICRPLNMYLIDHRGWKPALASLFNIFLCLVVLVLPMYFLGEIIITKMIDSQHHLIKLGDFLKQINVFVDEKTGFEILSEDNLNKVKEFAAQMSTLVLSSTVNALTIIFSMFFMLYFMFEKPRTFEKIVASALPFKRVNINLIGEKFRKLVVANAVGVPVVALGQGIVALIGYYIFGAPSPIVLFALTFVASMLPIVGAGIIFVPVSIFMMAEGNMGMGVGLLIYGLLIVGITDNVLRFTLLKKLEDIHPLNTVFGIVMGINLFGFMGLIFGPILVSMTLLLIQIYKDEFSGEDSTELYIPKNDEPEEKINLML